MRNLRKKSSGGLWILGILADMADRLPSLSIEDQQAGTLVCPDRPEAYLPHH
jgi:hypothetical protein